MFSTRSGLCASTCWVNSPSKASKNRGSSSSDWASSASRLSQSPGATLSGKTARAFSRSSRLTCAPIAEGPEGGVGEVARRAGEELAEPSLNDFTFEDARQVDQRGRFGEGLDGRPASLALAHHAVKVMPEDQHWLVLGQVFADRGVGVSHRGHLRDRGSTGQGFFRLYTQ